jgi:NAD(P)H-hydrate epimerase
MVSVFLPSSSEMQICDAATMNAGIPELELMERAGMTAAYEILLRTPTDVSYVVFSGPGNNGGDGFVIARWLHLWGRRVRCIYYQSKNAGDLWIGNLNRLKETGVVAERIEDFSAESFQLEGRVIKIDAILGSGQTRDARGEVARMVSLGNSDIFGSGALWISVDVPTGLNASSGAVYDLHVRPFLTITIQSFKRGFLQYPARDVLGNVVVVDIGILVDRSLCRYELITNYMCRQIYKPRPGNAHKGTLGSVVVMGGSSGMTGAPILAAKSSLQVGAGKVYVASGKIVINAIRAAELMTTEFDIATVKSDEILRTLGGMRSLVIGPGLGRDLVTLAGVRRVLALAHTLEIPTVVDADGLYALCDVSDGHGFGYENLILTPHPGEARALLGAEAFWVSEDRYQAVELLTKRFAGATVVLKGAQTIVYDGERGYVDCLGNMGLATAGSGDVLAGIIAGIRAQAEYKNWEAAVLGVWLHSSLVHLDVSYPLTVNDLLFRIPGVFQRIVA